MNILKAIGFFAILFVILFIIQLFVMGYCYSRETVFNYDEDDSKIQLTEEIRIRPWLQVGLKTRFSATLYIENVKDSIRFENLNVAVSCPDNKKQPITLLWTLALVSFSNDTYINAPTFDQLPSYNKTVRSKKDGYNYFKWIFETNNVDDGDLYIFTITGTAIYKGKRIKFRKTIKAERDKECVPYRMMT